MYGAVGVAAEGALIPHMEDKLTMTPRLRCFILEHPLSDEGLVAIFLYSP